MSMSYCETSGKIATTTFETDGADGERILRNITRETPETDGFSIIVHSRLQWDWVWQRPQQFLSRLSRRHPVLYIETLPPSPELKAPRTAIRRIKEYNVTVLQMQFPLSVWHHEDYVDRERRNMLLAALHGPLAGEFDSPIQWFYDPMAVTAFGGYIKSRAIVYDCMNEFSQFRGAPPEIVEREKLLLSFADVVFTGGCRLWEAKRHFNPNCHFYGCGVDVEHFSCANDKSLPLPEDIRHIAKPILGYFGVVDERLDHALIEKMAMAHPEWNIVMVGPTIKIGASALSKQPNIHWLGARPYAELPAYARAFDVCLIPYTLNETTEYINPTKTLEYMATARPIVSSSLADVVSHFFKVVEIGHSHTAFIEQCEKALRKPNQTKIHRGLEMANANTWDKIVSELEAHVQYALDRKQRRVSAQPYVGQVSEMLVN